MVEGNVSSEQTPSGPANITGLVQIGIAIGVGWLAWRQRGNAEGAALWGWLALALLCFGLGVFNLVAPRLRARFASTAAQPQRLAVRLSSPDASSDVIWTLFGLGLAFALPIIPLFVFALRMNQSDSDFTLLAVGATVSTLAIAGIMLTLSASQVYKRFMGGEAVVEIETRTLEPGQTTALYVAYRPGQWTPDAVAVYLVCRENSAYARHVQQRSYFRRRKTTLHILHNEEIVPEQPFSQSRYETWERTTSMTIPADARESYVSPVGLGPSSSIDWAVELEIKFDRLPDFRLSFPCTVAYQNTNDDTTDDEAGDESGDSSPAQPYVS